MYDHRLVKVLYDDRIKAVEKEARFRKHYTFAKDPKRSTIFTMIASIFSSKDLPEAKQEKSAPQYKLEKKFSSR